MAAPDASPKPAEAAPAKKVTVSVKTYRKCSGQQSRVTELEQELHLAIDQDEAKSKVDREIEQRKLETVAIEAALKKLRELRTEHLGNPTKNYFDDARLRYIDYRDALLRALRIAAARPHWRDDSIAGQIEGYATSVSTAFHKKKVKRGDSETEEDGHFDNPKLVDDLFTEGANLIRIMKRRTVEVFNEDQLRKREDQAAEAKRIARGGEPVKGYLEILKEGGGVRETLQEIVEEPFWKREEFKGTRANTVAEQAAAILEMVYETNPTPGTRRGTIDKTKIGEIHKALQRLADTMRIQLREHERSLSGKNVERLRKLFHTKLGAAILAVSVGIAGTVATVGTIQTVKGIKRVFGGGTVNTPGGPELPPPVPPPPVTPPPTVPPMPTNTF